MFLESLINRTLKIYADNDIGIFHKKNVPVVFSGIKANESGKPEIERGWIATKSTTDYYGIYNGTFIAFEAKSTNLQSLPLSNIKDHQLTYINRINAHGGLGFFIICFATQDEYYLLHPDAIQNMTRKSLSLNECRLKAHRIELVYPGILDFAPILDKLIKK